MSAPVQFPDVQPALLAQARDWAEEVAAAGATVGLPFVAATADIANPAPMLDPEGRPLAETVFRWLDPELRYWEDRAFALKAAFVHATRVCAEPLFFAEGRFGTWRRSAPVEALNAQGPVDAMGVGGAIIAPAYLPGGVIGAVTWATDDPRAPVSRIFGEHAAPLHGLALRFIATYSEAVGCAPPNARLTRREIQVLKWVAGGKTDAEISQLVGVALPTVRFHITNASRKLNASGRASAVRNAARLGYLGGLSVGPAA